ncbi:MAG: DUF5723 family protein [Bacteroidota bacterium]
MRFYNIVVILLMMLTIHQLEAQEQIGLRTDNYSGVNSLLLNPANNLTSKFSWDVNLISFGHFTENNYAFIRNTNLIDILKNTDNIRPMTDFENESQIDPDVLILDYFDDNRNRYASTLTTITGPSFMVNLDGVHSFGLFTNVRTAVSAQKIPASLSYYNIERTALGDPIDIPAFQVAGMAWSEIGLNYAYGQPTARGELGLGISLKFLNGYEAFFFENQADISFTELPNDTFSFSQAAVEFGLTTGNTDGEDFNRERNGGGLAVDLGFTYTLDGSEDSYLWKFSAAIVDFGRIKFNNSAELHRLELSNAVSIDGTDYNGFETVEDYTNTISEQVLGDPTASLVAREFSIWLPAALNLQADYNIAPNFYAHALLVQRLPINLLGNTIERNNLLALTPRFEHRWFGASVPVVLYNWRDFRIGMSARIGFLTIGSDNIGSITRRSNFTGTDFYVGLKVNPFELFSGDGGVPGWRPSKGKNVKCYQF